MFWQTPSGAYYVGVQVHRLDASILERPSSAHVWDGSVWRAESEQERNARKRVESASKFDGDDKLKAIAIWIASKLGIPLAQARTEILAILESL